MRALTKKGIERENLKAWRIKVLTRDNKTCQVCGKRPSKPHCHHIIPSQFNAFKFDENNGITLCFYHHKVGKLSAHLNALWFTSWLKENKPEQFKYLIERFGLVNI